MGKLAIVTLGVAVLVTPLLGCTSFPTEVAEDTIEYNKSLAKAERTQLLLNVVRATKDQPIFFTSIPNLTQKISMDSNLSFSPSVTIGAAGMTRTTGTSGGSDTRTHASTRPTVAGVSAGTAGVTFSGGPTVSMNVLDTQEFWRGFMKPPDAELIKYYWDMGWRKGLLLQLFAREMTVADWRDLNGNGKIEKKELTEASGTTVTGYPLKRKQYEEYLRIIREIVANKPVLHIGSYEEEDRVGPEIDEALAREPAFLKLAQEEGFSIERSTKALLNEKGEKVLDGKGDVKTEEVFHLVSKRRGRSVGLKWRIGKETIEQDGKKREIETARVTTKIQVRSPEAILYHLGELAKVVEAAKSLDEAWMTPYEDGTEELLFLAASESALERLGISTESALVWVSYEGVDYYVPKASGRSMKVFTMLLQLISLQRTVKESPKGGVFTLVG